MRNRIFSTDSPKAIKADKYGWLNAIHYMAPWRFGGVGNLCPFADGCEKLCLGHYSGQASMVRDLERDDNSVRKSRRDKAQRFMRDRHGYMTDMVRAIFLEKRRAIKIKRKLAVRPNGSTDIAYESVRDAKGLTIFDLFPDIAFLDYTKNPRRFDRKLPHNYHLTFSRSAHNEPVALELLARGVNVAVVFERKPVGQWKGFDVVDGDLHDLRHLDPRANADHPHGYVIALSPKGRKAKADTSGFVVRE